MHAPFAQHALWVTRSRDGELYAAGDYPNQGRSATGYRRTCPTGPGSTARTSW